MQDLFEGRRATCLEQDWAERRLDALLIPCTIFITLSRPNLENDMVVLNVDQELNSMENKMKMESTLFRGLLLNTGVIGFQFYFNSF